MRMTPLLFLLLFVQVGVATSSIKCTISEILRLYLKHFTCQKKKYVQVCTYLPNTYMEQTGKFQNMCNTNLADDVVISKVVHHKRCTWGLVSFQNYFCNIFRHQKDFFNHLHSTLLMCISGSRLQLLNCPLGLGLYFNPLYR